MSTKAIREALERVRWDGLSGNEHPAFVAAMAEVEAIERAARVWYAVVIGVESSPASDAFAPFERIAIYDQCGAIPRCASPGCSHYVMNTGGEEIRPKSAWCYEHTKARK